MKFIIASSGKYHHFNLAKAYLKNNLWVYLLVILGLKLKRKMIPKEFVFVSGCK